MNQKPTGKEDHSISLADAAKFTARFRAKAEKGTVIGGYFGRDAIEKILAQEGCIGIRYYFAETDDGKPTLVLVGVDADGNDMAKGVLAEVSWPCPPFCGEQNTLNS